ncbi:MAG: GNAT family N-acetyltransferase, partial [Chloroflexales bacterium]|nr:GNAT family N-acetyltransferase [Chloroflexales bacterium]
MASPNNLAPAADENLATHAGWVHLHTPGMRVVDAPDLVLVDSGLPCDTFNIVCRARLAPENASERLRTAIDHFAAVGRPFSWWLTPGNQPPDLGARLVAAGLQCVDSELAMAAELATIPALNSWPSGLQIRRIHTLAQLHDFAAIIASGWSPPDGDVLRFYALAAQALLRDDAPLWLYVGYLDQVPVATAELTVGGGVVGLYNIVTLEAYRRRGIGTAMTVQPLLDAREQGHRTAIL